MKTMTHGHNMKVVVSRTGLSPHVLRIWEKRYDAVTPRRSDGNRRLYSEQDIHKLELLARLTRQGHSIGTVAGLKIPELQHLVGEATPASDPTAPQAGSDSFVESLIDAAMKAVVALDPEELERAFDRATVAIGYSGMLERVIHPFVQRTGDAWQEGKLTAAQEHAASAVVKQYLSRTARPFSAQSDAPNLLVTTPTGQLHELGASLAAAMARKQGWNVTYLGPSLPAEEIAGAAIRTKARAVALSIVYPPDDANLPDELRRLRRLLPPELSIVAGGRAAQAYGPTLEEVGADMVDSLPALGGALDRIRNKGVGE